MYWELEAAWDNDDAINWELEAAWDSAGEIY